MMISYLVSLDWDDDLAMHDGKRETRDARGRRRARG